MSHTIGVQSSSTPSLSSDVVEALDILHRRYGDLTKDGREVTSYSLDRIDRALDELLRHPERAGNPERLVSNAMGNAGKVLRDRVQLLSPPNEFDDPTDAHKQALRMGELEGRFGSEVDSSVDQLQVEVLDAIDRSALTRRDKRIAVLLLDGAESEDIASEFSVSRPNAQVWISRTRERAAHVWAAA